MERGEGEDELEEPDGQEGGSPEARRGSERHDTEAEDDPGRAHDADEPARDPDLGLGDEVGHEALVGALGEVRAQLEPREERGVEEEQTGRAECRAVPAERLDHRDEREAADEEQIE